ncbi:CENPC protein, partial [Spelaeornis formosus]|nr:CENPC protein [Elachura formosa]
SEKEKIQNKKVDNRKVEVKALKKQKMDHLDVGAFDFKEMSESDPIPNSKENVLTSQSQRNTRMGKTKRYSFRQNSNQQKNTSWRPEAEELILSGSGLETKPSDEVQCEAKMPVEDLPVPSPGHQEEQTESLKRSLRSSKKLASKASQLKEKQTKQKPEKKQTKQKPEKKQTKQKPEKKQTKQKLPKVKVAKGSPKKKLKKSVQQKPQLQREEHSDSESSEDLERAPIELNEVCTTPLHQKVETPVIQKITKSRKPRNVLHTPESFGGANNRSPLKALQHPMEIVKDPEKKSLSAKSSGKIPKKVPRRTNEALRSSSEGTESQTDSDSSSVPEVTRKKQKLPDVKTKSNKRKHNRQHGPHSGPVGGHGHKFPSSTESSEGDCTSSGNDSEDLNCRLRRLFSDEIIKHKIVMPSNTPDVRRSKRIRLKPLEYWRGEHLDYTMDASGGLVISGLVHPKAEPPRKSGMWKDHLKQKKDIINRRERPACLDQCLADASKPTIVVDPVTNQEVRLGCVNTARGHTYFCKDEAVEIYKDLNTSLFATGRLFLKPYKEKGQQYVPTDTITFHIIHGKVIVTLHKTSYCLTEGDCFYVPAGNVYNIRNLLNEESVLLFTQLKD